MLNLGAVKRQIDAMVVDRKSGSDDYADRVGRAVKEWARWRDESQLLADKVAKAKMSWLVARPIDPVTTTEGLPTRPKALTVIATDGSQIFPDRNEVATCFLVNLGYVVITYGTGERPILDSEPALFYADADLYQEWSGRKSVITREQVGHRRMAMEFTKLTELAEAEERSQPTVAMSDGTLILWMLEGKPLAFRRSTLQAFLSAMDRLRAVRIPVCGYISDPGGSDVIKTLRVGMCPENPTHCDRCPCLNGSPGDAPVGDP